MCMIERILLSILLLCLARRQCAQHFTDECGGNGPPIPLRGKRHYVVGVLAIRGVDNAFAEYNQTFNEYLTQQVGSRFEPPVTFSMRAMGFNDIRQYVCPLRSSFGSLVETETAKD